MSILASAEELLDRSKRHAEGSIGDLASRVAAGMAKREEEAGGPRVTDPREPVVVRATPFVSSHERLAEIHADKVQGKHVRFVNVNEQIRNLRRWQGYEPVLDEKNEEIRDMDTTMMSMHRERHEQEIKAPREETKRQKRMAIRENFADKIREQGGEPTGSIDYDVRRASDNAQ